MNLKNIVTSQAGELLTAAAKDMVRGVAPNLANVLDGPLSQIAQNEISRQLTGKTDTPVADLEQRIMSMSAEDVSALTNAQAKVMEAAHRANVEIASIGARDRADARQAHAGDRTPMALALLSFAALVALGGALMFLDVPEQAEGLLNMVFGALVVMAKQGFDFFLGSSAGSKAKTDILSKSPR